MQNNPLCALFYTSMFQTYNRSRCCSTTIVYNIKYLGHVDILHGVFVMKRAEWTFCMVEYTFSAHGR